MAELMDVKVTPEGGNTVEQPFDTAVRSIAQDRLKRNLLFEATRTPVDLPKSSDPADYYHKRVARALFDFRNATPLPGDVDSFVNASVARIRNGTGVHFTNKNVSPEGIEKYAQGAEGLINQIKGLNMRIPPPVSEHVKGNILRRLNGFATSGDAPAQLVQAYKTFEELMIAAVKQDLTPTEAKNILDIERSYKSKIGGTPERRLHGNSLDRARQFEEAKVKLEQSAFPQQPEFVVDEKEDYVDAFKTFIAKNKTQLPSYGVNRVALRDFIYLEFYGRQAETDKYKPGSSEAAQATRELKVRDAWVEQGIRSAGLNPRRVSGWLYSLPKDPASYEPDSTDLGRFYLNVKPETVPSVFKFLADYIGKHNYRIDAKMIDIQTVDPVNYLNRADKVVMYFGKDTQQQAIEVAQVLGRQYATAFETLRPRFTVGVKDDRGRELPGVGYGQEPIPNQNGGLGADSFGERRSLWLADAVIKAYGQGLWPDVLTIA